MLGVMFLAILYGAYELFFTAPKKPDGVTEKAATDLRAFIGNMTASLTKDAPSPVVAYTIKRMEAEWLRDPFYAPKNDREWLATKEAAQPGGTTNPGTPKGLFNYTGYVDTGHKKIAIVNGSEYAAGEALDVGGVHVLKGISPDRITIYNKETGRTLEIPMQE